VIIMSVQPTSTNQPTKPADSKPAETAKSKDNGKAKRGRPAGSEARVWDYTGLDLTVLQTPAAVTQELASLAAPTRARDERQVAIDKVVQGLHVAWETTGKPDKWAQMPKASYHVPPQAADTVAMLVRRAANFYGYSAKFGKPVRDAQGMTIVVFAVRDSRKRAVKAGSDTFTLEDLREFLTDFYGDDTEGADQFLAAFEGDEGESDSDDNADES
jgi:hypothetical protein